MKSKTKIIVAIASVIALHAIPFGGLILVQGCKKDAEQVATSLETERNDEIPLLNTEELYSKIAAEGTSETEEMPSQTWRDNSEMSESVSESHQNEITNTPTLPREGSQSNSSLQENSSREMSRMNDQNHHNDRNHRNNRIDRNVRNDRNVQNDRDDIRSNPLGNDYEIKRGDRLYTLARRFGIPLDDLLNANPGIDPRRLRIGQSIRIPNIPKSRTVAKITPTSGKTYLVKRGDTLTRIARQYGVSLRDLKEANSLQTDRILIGQRIKVPVSEVASATRR